ncbi:MAG: phosphoheptose isomerase [Armatimonadetes bacterium CG_4_10_14_3_um_filter_66_18]|nr:SIS domain-containing protein [Armatimonadota bacterium]OIP09038.1 MAG: phosphoheptose isomerase [Armatimonadetes bacterium CG2_30_66_41]PIU88375.1 MAG: phosphoheptose isomerase [Armatimonadetes bacterium CG06_land_8_20_14_3_00_66_21]PIX46906.1 MAG: phosphoheptose isomerase [Armatimonadetes bacterium CG_4_8_14_3_um_filter_66_20]PIY50143.1 MAG: phosphoheptose isomerase [Armatimonadetes bacterium CG_4_10_14_3_um_filter_66_18]PIZ51587.1 MAG: phosphoheptose isomerase [Armatimonadetes bacterium 
MSYATDYLMKLRTALDSLDAERIDAFCEIVAKVRDEGRQLFVCGNGGSSATASHFASDLGKGGSLGKPKRFKVLSLSDNVPWFSSLANDINYESVFVEQLRNFAEPGDVLIAISGSGNSPNVLRAVEYANEIGMVTIGVAGFKGGKLAPLCRHSLIVDSNHMGRIEDGHFVVMHVLAYYFMEQ